MRTILVFTLLLVMAFSCSHAKKYYVQKGIHPNEIRDILISNIPKFSKCYENAYKKSKEPYDGIVKLKFVIGSEGKVISSDAEGGKKGLSFKANTCLKNELSKIQFPEPVGGGTVEVRQPMNFYPKEVKKEK